ncbi:hypothetical protein P7K49_006095, partial [Saguinus oedipus]
AVELTPDPDSELSQHTLAHTRLHASHLFMWLETLRAGAMWLIPVSLTPALIQLGPSDVCY